MFLTITLLIIIAISTFNWVKWYITTAALVYYLEKQHKQPNKREMEECTAYVMKNFLKIKD